VLLAREFAESVSRNHGRDPWKVAARLRLRVRRAKLPGQHQELYVQRRSGKRAAALVIASGVRGGEARALVAHGIAHHLMHAGDRVSGESRAVWSGRHEREAEDFAALLLMPDKRLRHLERESLQKDVADLAEDCEVPEALARRRLALAARRT
jgi:hypothetical protein